ncbi:Insulin-like growth factor binding protein, N-terminal [Pseudocohnilembus persalinus]|uniref:Insulin-like growth factor binding protein, N-terminal n=1 Tax=Pseudocohnilembus persalinus TaxID=266149 RepID=A0A0V0QGK3_PSEPJ|nr:Insulin-like growth factor binding protein, N-terminal [Pseudocohnilembus persalinus]|eukprot:KRX01334.1 Insulin-like growth factor binding protein, N-terminal [Pseudocohnilembus persalinus]
MSKLDKNNGFQKNLYNEHNYTVTFAKTFTNIPEIVLSYGHIDHEGSYTYIGVQVKVMEVTLTTSVDGSIQTLSIQSQGECTSLKSMVFLNYYQDNTGENNINLKLISEPAHLGGTNFEVQVQAQSFSGDASKISEIGFVIFSTCSDFLQTATHEHGSPFSHNSGNFYIDLVVSQTNKIYTATERFLMSGLNGFINDYNSLKLHVQNNQYTSLNATYGQLSLMYRAATYSWEKDILVAIMVFINPDCNSPCKACQGSLSYCIECNDGQYLVGSTCFDCADKCATCETSSTNCLTCSASANFNAASDCTCVDKYYFDGSECQDCPTECATCSDYSTCSSCVDGYYKSGNACPSCHHSCGTCSAYHTCSTCSDTNREQTITCPCKDKFFDDGDASCENCPTECATCTDFSTCQSCENGYYLSGNDCLPCHYSCDTCSDYHICTTCSDTNRDGTSLCDCEDKFFDDGDATCENCPTECATCTDFSTCQTCEDGYYLSGNDCLQCHYSCDTCSDYHVCVTCSHYQRPSTPDCDCASGYYDDGTYQCQQCQYPCSTCTALNTCSSCVNTQFRNSDCSCLDGYFDDTTECVECHESCQTCDFDECFTCQESRVPDSVGTQECICPTDDIAGIDHYIQLNTYKCTIELPSFSEDFSVYSTQLCAHLFDSTQLSIFGNSPLCKLVDSAHSLIYIQFQYTSTYQQGDSIYFLPNIIKRQGCTLLMNQIEIFQVNNVDTSTLDTPSIKIEGETIYSICRSINFSIDSIKNDGKHDLINLQWTLDSVDFPSGFDIADDDPTYINDINTNYLSGFNGERSLYFPSYYLEQMSTYTIIITFNNYLSMPGSYTLTFQILGDTQSIIQFSETYEPLVIKPTNYQYIYYKIYNIVCQQDSDGSVTQSIVYDETDYQISEMTDDTYTSIANTIQTDTSNNIEENLMFTIEPYDYAAGYIYYLQFETIVTSYGIDIGQAINLSFEVEVLDYIVSVLNGNRQHSYTSELILEATYSDLNVEVSQQQSGFTLYWECESMVQDDGICRNIQNNPITMTQSVDNQQFAAKYFEPYSTFRYTFYAEKSSSNYTDSVLIIIIEEDVPSLSLDLPDTLMSGTTNLNDDLYLEVDYEADSSITLQYNAILMYNSDKVAIKSFEYKKFSFRIWDLFNDFESGNYQITIKITCYNPYFSLPAISTFNLNLNEPPTNCYLQVTPSTGVSLSTIFTLSILNCEDDNQPLNYKFSYYTNSEEYIEEKYSGTKSTALKKQTLQTYGTNYVVSTVLPRAQSSTSDGEDEGIIIMVSVKDSYNGITNITQTIQITPDPSISQQLNNVQTQLDSIISQTDQEKTRILGILSQELNMGKNDFYEENSTKFIEILESIQTKLNTLKKFLTVKSQIDQAVNSLYIIETMLNDFTVLTEFPINEQLDYTEYIVSVQQNLLQNLIDTNQISQSDSQVSLAVEQSKEILGKSYKSLDSYISIFNKKGEKNNTMAIEFQEKIKKIGQIYNNISLPNADPIIYFGNGVHVSSQKKTAEKLNELFTSVDAETLDQGQEIIFDEEATDDSIYDYLITSYDNNILQEDFIYPDQSNKLKQIQIKNNDTQEIIELNAPITFLFSDEIQLNETDNATNLWCLSYEDNDNSQKEWSNDKCQTVYYGSSNNIECVCETQNEVTIINDYNLVFSDTLSFVADSAQKAFTGDAVEVLADFEFLKSTIFYFIIVIGVFETYLVMQGIKKDKEEKAQYEVAQQYLKEKEVVKKNNKQDMRIYNMDDKQQIQNENEQKENDFQNNEETKTEGDQQTQNDKNSNEDILSPQDSQRRSSLQKLSSIKENGKKNSKYNIEQSQTDDKKQNFPDIKKPSIILNTSDDFNSDIHQSQKNLQEKNKNKDEKQENQEQKKKPIFNKKISIFNTFLVFHQFFQIFFVYVKKQSRAVRYLIYFLKIYLALAISSFFGDTGSYSQMQQIVINVVILFFTQIPLLFVKIFLVRKNFCVKFVGFLMFSAITLLSAWLIVYNSASIGAEQSNEWFISYLTGFFFDFGVTQSVTSTVLNYIILKFGRENKIIQLLLESDVINYYYLTYHDI